MFAWSLYSRKINRLSLPLILSSFLGSDTGGRLARAQEEVAGGRVEGGGEEDIPRYYYYCTVVL